jgi:NAD(P)-dependent dehydrogenase (short-subunit alcohol dehydrogenase family)
MRCSPRLSVSGNENGITDVDASLKGGAAIVTGATSGLGCGIGGRLAAEDARIVVARRPGLLSTLSREMTQAFGNVAAVGMPVDATRPEQLEAPVAEVANSCGGGHSTVA